MWVLHQGMSYFQLSRCLLLSTIYIVFWLTTVSIFSISVLLLVNFLNSEESVGLDIFFTVQFNSNTISCLAFSPFQLVQFFTVQFSFSKSKRTKAYYSHKYYVYIIIMWSFIRFVLLYVFRISLLYYIF